MESSLSLSQSQSHNHNQQQEPTQVAQEEEQQHAQADGQEQENGKKHCVYFKWGEEMTEEAQSILQKEASLMTEAMYQKLEKEARKNWDIFYKNNKTNFYKDRHYIKFEFQELSHMIDQLDALEGVQVTREEIPDPQPSESLVSMGSAPLEQQKQEEQKEEDKEETKEEFKQQDNSQQVNMKLKKEKVKRKEMVVRYSGEVKTKIRLLDVGCGVGNGLYPLYREFQHRLVVNCCDFSPRAVNFVKGHELYKPEDIDAQVCDLVNEELPFEPSSANFAIMLFVMSAISPENFHKTAKKIYDQMLFNEDERDEELKQGEPGKGGILYFRDYGRYDLAQLRLAQRGNQKLKDNFYIRSDKTRAYYFTIEEVREIFESAGFKTLENEYHYRLIENRKDNKRMHRVWIQAKFQKTRRPIDRTASNTNQQALDQLNSEQGTS